MVGRPVPFRGDEAERDRQAARPKGRLRSDRSGLAGDEQVATRSITAAVEMAIHHYPHDHYPAWREELDGHPLLQRRGGLRREYLDRRADRGRRLDRRPLPPRQCAGGSEPGPPAVLEDRPQVPAQGHYRAGAPDGALRLVLPGARTGHGSRRRSRSSWSSAGTKVERRPGVPHAVPQGRQRAASFVGVACSNAPHKAGANIALARAVAPGMQFFQRMGSSAVLARPAVAGRAVR